MRIKLTIVLACAAICLTYAWEKSEDHCKALMDPLQTHLGAGNANTYWVQEFGSYR